MIFFKGLNWQKTDRVLGYVCAWIDLSVMDEGLMSYSWIKKMLVEQSYLRSLLNVHIVLIHFVSCLIYVESTWSAFAVQSDVQLLRRLLNLNSVNQLIFVMVKCGVLFEVRTEFLNII
jgi:hypothetical protein